ncbi:MAG: anaphase promoting complex subunit doc1 [Watsoniomyces obsoletus]|nr:MAG: anaphase promoting complex subunit doc1 [Watsoniomyces obsoletus]
MPRANRGGTRAMQGGRISASEDLPPLAEEFSADDIADADARADDYGEMDDDDDNEDADSPETDQVDTFDTTGLRDIGNLASWRVSTFKPGCGVDALRDEDTKLFWQSDGPQPHILNIHFIKMVNIRHIRIYLDFSLDESYTPTRIQFLAGTGYHDLIDFAELSFEQPKGWIEVDLTGVGGGPDGNTLRAFIVQMKVLENHQNGKDTHVRGVKIYAAETAGSGQRTTRNSAEGGLGLLADEAEPDGGGAAAPPEEPSWSTNLVIR